MNKVYLGDSLEIMPTIDDKSVDMILCDLPYGTTACIHTNRKFIGIEKNKEYFEVAKKRIIDEA